MLEHRHDNDHDLALQVVMRNKRKRHTSDPAVPTSEEGAPSARVGERMRQALRLDAGVRFEQAAEVAAMQVSYGLQVQGELAGARCVSRLAEFWHVLGCTRSS